MINLDIEGLVGIYRLKVGRGYRKQCCILWEK